MKLKKLLSSTLVGLSMLALAGTASATNYITSDINLYGASSTYAFWTTGGPNGDGVATDYMKAAGCSGFSYGQTSDGKNFIIVATCPTDASGDTATINFRYTSKSSYDGIMSAESSNSTTFTGRVTTCDGTGYNYRPMLETTGCTLGTTPSTAGTCTTTKCEPITVGLADTNCSCFSQKSAGWKYGPYHNEGTSTDSTYSMNMTNLPCPGAPGTTNPSLCTALVVPFTFYVNNSVKDSNGNTITNISYDNLQLIFSGQVDDWADLLDNTDTPYAEQTLNVCMRHAGSGTEASLEAYLMAAQNCSKSNPLAVSEWADTNVYFNDGTGDMMNCINGGVVTNGSWSSTGNITWTGPGAIGFADADVNSSGKYGNVTILTVGGAPTGLTTANGLSLRKAIQNGSYNFYGMQHYYGIAQTSPLCAFLNTDKNIYGAGGKGTGTTPWSIQTEMNVQRINTCCSWGLTDQNLPY